MICDNFDSFLSSKVRYVKRNIFKENVKLSALIDNVVKFCRTETWQSYNVYMSHCRQYGKTSLQGSLYSLHVNSSYYTFCDNKVQVIELPKVIDFGNINDRKSLTALDTVKRKPEGNLIKFNNKISDMFDTNLSISDQSPIYTKFIEKNKIKMS